MVIFHVYFTTLKEVINLTKGNVKPFCPFWRTQIRSAVYWSSERLWRWFQIIETLRLTTRQLQRTKLKKIISKKVIALYWCDRVSVRSCDRALLLLVSFFDILFLNFVRCSCRVVNRKVSNKSCGRCKLYTFHFYKQTIIKVKTVNFIVMSCRLRLTISIPYC